jgi:adenosylhomocysteine nucleosidase
METARRRRGGFANTVPFIGFRRLSDLAGGSAGDNEMETFMGLAAANAAAALEGFLAER